MAFLFTLGWRLSALRWGYDEKILEPLREHEPTSPIIFEWKYELRPRIVKLFTREEITTKPFYEMEEIPLGWDQLNELWNHLLRICLL